MALLAVVARRHRHVFDKRADLAQADQHRAFEKIPRVEARKLESAEGRAVDRGIAVGRIEDMPLAARGLDEKRQAGVADAPPERHAPERGGVVKAISFRV